MQAVSDGFRFDATSMLDLIEVLEKRCTQSMATKDLPASGYGHLYLGKALQSLFKHFKHGDMDIWGKVRVWRVLNVLNVPACF